MNLLIVESPNKIKKLKSLLGKDWEVAASVGHIRDLPAKNLSIDKANGYKMLYQLNDDKKSVVAALQNKVKAAGKENVYLATDPDREGEAISFHLCAALGLNYKTSKRVSFQEITKGAVLKAIEAPRTIDLNLVSAQETRRAIDRLVGYEISPVLWRKLESGLSAGRVQSVALRLCVEREKQILSFADRFNYQLNGWFKTTKGDTLKAKKKDYFQAEEDAYSYLQNSVSKTFRVTDITTKPAEKLPQPPYSTSSLQQDGVKKLKMNVKRVMDVAQKLFEGGHITYMRTDSQNLSESATAEAKIQITNQYGGDYFEQRQFKSKAGSQEAHEAIRPTDWNNAQAGDTEEERRLYDLIYRRALASQMKAARFDETIISIESEQPDDLYTSKAKIMTYDGYLKVYQEEKEEDDKEEDEDTIQPVEVGEVLEMLKLEARQVYAKPPRRFDQATLVAELEKKQIGRPSTYASILNTIMYRQYVKTGNAEGKQLTAALLTLENGELTRSEKTETLGSDKNKLIPTEKGIRLTEFMESNFAQVVDYQFTAKCEDLFDEIAEGKRNFAQIVPAFDRRLAKWVEHVNENYQDIPAENQLEIGQYEEHPLLVGKGKFGVYVSHKGTYYPVDDRRKPETVTVEDAIAAIEKKRATMPREIGIFEGKAVQTGKGKFGTYVLFEKKYINVEDKEPDAVSLEEAIALIEAKRAQMEERKKSLLAQIGKKYQIHNGKWGLYVTDGKIFANLPKNVSVEEAAGWKAEQCKKTIADYLEWKEKQTKEGAES
ncbi:type I DNA topoisomerase [Nafulsella turpanensis]|uniref:type I DNA topoisomerase n=1 Tax=Nafulsella turpanensis TaxID=1265690 RepID=UPI00034AD589|nr:type I DNA topoisomerase [Nafulsella turpanensis]